MIITGKYPNLRMRRSRKANWSRRLISENNLSVNDLVLPIFVIEGNNKIIAINISTYSEKTFTCKNKTIFNDIRFMDVYEDETNINIVTSTFKNIYINRIPKKKLQKILLKNLPLIMGKQS